MTRFSSNWSRNRAVAYLLNPTLWNASMMSLSEGLSQWTNPELVSMGLSMGIVGSIAVKGGGKELYNFGKKAGQHITEAGRKVPIQIMDDILKTTKGLPDPGGSRALMYYSPMWKNGKLYNLEILYDKASGSIWHFKYTQDALGSLPLIK